MAETAKPSGYIDAALIVKHTGLVPGQRVGDFGVGGAATFAMTLADTVGGQGQVLMFDVKKSALSGAMSMAKVHGVNNCRAVWSNLETYKGASGVTDNSLDAGLLINVLDQSTKHKDILAETSRMLKPGAKFVVVDWKPDVALPIAPQAKSRVADGHVEQVAQSLGMTTLEKFEAGPYHWGLVLVKT